MNGNAPYVPVIAPVWENPGDQLLPVKKCSPDFMKTGHARYVVVPIMSARMTSTAMPDARSVQRKTASAFGRRLATAKPCDVMSPADRAWLTLRVDQRDVRERLRLEVGEQRRVMQLQRDGVPAVDDP